MTNDKLGLCSECEERPAEIFLGGQPYCEECSEQFAEYPKWLPYELNGAYPVFHCKYCDLLFGASEEREHPVCPDCGTDATVQVPVKEGEYPGGESDVSNWSGWLRELLSR